MFAFVRTISVFTLAAAGLLAQTTTPAPAQETRTFGMIGVAEGQTARLNVLNPGVLPPALGAICAAQLTFYDADGQALKTTTVSVTPGKSASFDIQSDKDLALAADERKEIRATITIPPVVPAAGATAATSAACTLIGTLEIFDTLSGRTLVALGATHPVPSAVATPAQQ